jgi:hypothetical protein
MLGSPKGRGKPGPQAFNQVGTLAQQLAQSRRPRRGEVRPLPEMFLKRLLVTLQVDPEFRRVLRRLLFAEGVISP